MYKSYIILGLLILVSESYFAQSFTKITEGYIVNDDRYSERSSWGDVNNDNYLEYIMMEYYCCKIS